MNKEIQTVSLYEIKHDVFEEKNAQTQASNMSNKRKWDEQKNEKTEGWTVIGRTQCKRHLQYTIHISFISKCTKTICTLSN